MINLKVELGQNSYPIFIGHKILDKLAEMLKLYDLGQTAVVITDSNVEKIYRQELAKYFERSLHLAEIITMPAGEKAKSFSTVEKLLSRMLDLRYERNLTVLAVGGGVVGDLAGFLASVYKRGVNFIQVPTTLLAQVDASIGGKTGVNHPTGKNLIGTFYQPKLVWSDLQFLQTLPAREIVCGLGEVIKYGIIKEPELFLLCEENLDKIYTLDSALISDLVFRSCKIKAEVVSKDEREQGLRMILNFGHTIGHAIEAAHGYKRISHGEAVLMGMLAESWIAAKLKLLSQNDFDRILKLVSRFNLREKLSGLSSDEIERFIKTDKKIQAGKIRFVLPREIGAVEIYDDVETAMIVESVDFILGASG